MLNTLISISSKLYRMKPIVALCAVFSLATFFCSLFDIGYLSDETFLIPALAGFIWSVLFFVLLGAVDFSYVLETEVIYLDTEAFALKFSHSKREVNNEGRRINGPARRVFLKTHLLGVESCLFG